MPTEDEEIRLKATTFLEGEQPRVERGDGEQSVVTLWTLAALTETLILVGGMMWVMNGSATVSLPTRALIVAACALAGGGAFAAVALRQKSK